MVILNKSKIFISFSLVLAALFFALPCLSAPLSSAADTAGADPPAEGTVISEISVTCAPKHLMRANAFGRMIRFDDPRLKLDRIYKNKRELYKTVYEVTTDTESRFFFAGNVYLIHIFLEPAEGCSFADSVTVTFNGETFEKKPMIDAGGGYPYLDLSVDEFELRDNNAFHLFITKIHNKLSEKKEHLTAGL